MPDTRSHRGAHPDDERIFAADGWPRLRCATGDLCWLLSRGYATLSAIKLVGDRYALTARQRTAVARCACSDEAARRREECRVEAEQLSGCELCIDGYNVLITLEAALGGGVILHARDGCYRDMASMHGSYRKVEETLPALRLLGETIAGWQLANVRWLLDSRPAALKGCGRRGEHEFHPQHAHSGPQRIGGAKAAGESSRLS